MKKFYLLLTLALFANVISAQQYVPLLDSVNIWSYNGLVFGVRLGPTVQNAPCTYPTNIAGASFKEYTTNDTLIDSLTYKVVMQSTAGPCSLGFIREDTAARKVYFISNNDTAEKVLYDFSMQVGDTMTMQFYQQSGYVNGLYTLDSITNVQIAAGTRRAFWFACHSVSGSRVFSWVEGVGNQNDLLYPYFNNQPDWYSFYTSCPGVQHEFQQFLICFEHQTKVYFDTCAYSTSLSGSFQVVTDSCDYFSFISAIEEYSSTAAMNIFPNPSSGQSTVSLDVKQKGDFELLVWDVNGKHILKEIDLGSLTEGKKEIELDLSSFSNGIYVVELKTEKGSAYSKLLISK